jgi:hypothetical protein
VNHFTNWHLIIAVTFLISQVGDDDAADQFLDTLGGDTAIDRVLYRTSGM